MKEMKVNSSPGSVTEYDPCRPLAPDWLDYAVDCASRDEIARAVRNGRRGPDNGNTQRMRVYDDFG